VTDTHKGVAEALAEKARLLDLSSDAILVRDVSDRITFWNQGATELYGYNREDAIGRISHELLHTEFPEPVERIREKFTREGRWAGDLRHRCADGRRITVSTRWVAERDTHGTIISILESNRNISGIRQAEETQNRLAAIVESSDDAIVSKDLNGIIQSWNTGAERIFGYTAEQAIGQPITIIVPAELHEEEKQILAQLRAGERIEHFETIRQTKTGERRFMSLTISPVRDGNGRIVGASKIGRDITERKKVERALREAELSGRMLQLQDEERRRVARELHDGAGQLLAALSMNIAAIASEKQKLGPKAARCAEENSSLVSQAISEIRTISHLLHPPLLDEVGLQSALTEYVHGFGERSKIHVSLDLPSNLERLPRDVELSLFRIVQECLTNIHRHSGSPTAHVRLSRSPGEIQLEVSDQGRGIDPEIQESFFAGKGSGVGLRGMRERVRQLGGGLEIESLGNGTIITVVLPLLGDDNKPDEPDVAIMRNSA
jgi:PAS domain S-box-containing protein